MLEFNINGRLINIDGRIQTPEQLALLPKIESILTIMHAGDLSWKSQSILIELTNQYDSSLNPDTLFYSFRDHRLSNKGYIVDGKRMQSVPQGAFWCERCQEWHTTKHTEHHTTADNYLVCDRVMKDYVIECRVCHKKFLYIHDNYQYMCHDCLVETQKYRIKRYHDNPQLKFYTEDGQSTSTYGDYYGLELEVDRGGESNDMSKDVIKLLQERVYTMHDGSLENGFEIITHPHTEKALKDLNWKETFKWLVHKGYRSHDIPTCGLHLHINRAVFKTEDSLAKMLYFYEKYFDEVLKVSRRDRNRADRWSGRYYRDSDYVWGAPEITLDKMREVIDEYDGNGEHDMRYKCVNLQKSKTVEIRIMRGTLNYNSFMACLDFMMTVAKNSNKVRDIDSWDEWLDGIDDNTKNYLGARRAFGYPPEEQSINDDDYNMTNEEIRNMEETVCAL